jgi:salicylate hydroxylase
MHVLIAGGGIGGMSAALALLRAGIQVSIYEQAPELKEVGAGIQLSPNGCRALDELGVFAQLKQLSCDPVRKEFRIWNTGEAWPMFDLGAHVIKEYGYPYLTVYRPDLLSVLAGAVEAIDPTVIHLGKRIMGCSQDDLTATLTFEDGSTATGDVLIGADGWRSVIRTDLWGDMSPQFSGMVAWRSIIPMNTLPKHLQESVGTTWIGPGAHVVTYPLHGGEIMNFVATVEGKTWDVKAPTMPGEKSECLEDFAGWHEDVMTYINAAPQLLKWALVVGEPIPAWTKGRITLLGDACHATLPFLAQGAVHSIEDAVVLTRCLLAESDADKALLRYEAARIERTSKMVRGATANTGRFHSEELRTEEGARVYLEREMSASPIADRYDWLYRYDAVTAPI